MLHDKDFVKHLTWSLAPRKEFTRGFSLPFPGMCVPQGQGIHLSPNPFSPIITISGFLGSMVSIYPFRAPVTMDLRPQAPLLWGS